MTVWLTTVCTEREPDGVYEDCTWASGVMLANEAHGRRRYPQTQAEYEALRADGNDPVTPGNPGSNVDDLLLGLRVRYQLIPSRLTTWAQVAAVPIGTALVPSGLYASLPARLRRWSNFTGGHAVCVVRIEAGWWWLDPLAPKDYAGESISATELRAFFTGVAGPWALAVTVGQEAEDMVPLPITDVARALVDVGAGAYFYDLDRVTQLVPLTSGGKDVLQLFTSGAFRAVRISTGGIIRLALAKVGDLTNIRPIADGTDVSHVVVLTVDGTQVYGGKV